MKNAKRTMVLGATSSLLLLGSIGQAQAQEGMTNASGDQKSLGNMVQKPNIQGKQQIVERMKAEGMDVSSITQEMIDSSDEKAFWDAIKVIRSKKEVEMRRGLVEKAKAEGVDVSSITEEMITNPDGKKFWDTMKVVKDAREIVARKKVVEEMKAKGMDTSGFTEEVIADGQKFWELAKSLRMEKEMVNYQKNKEQLEKKTGVQMVKKEDMEKRKAYLEEKKTQFPEYKGKIDERVQKLNENGEKLEKNMEKTKEHLEKVQVKINNQATRPILSEMARKKLIAKLEAVPAEKRAATLESLEAKLNKQIETAKSKKLKLTVKRLEETLAITREVLSQSAEEESEDSIIDGINP